MSSAGLPASPTAAATPSPQDQLALLQQLLDQLRNANPPQAALPAGDTVSKDQPPGSAPKDPVKTPEPTAQQKQPVAKQAPAMQAGVVPNAILNQGQLIKTPSAIDTGSSSKTGSTSKLDDITSLLGGGSGGTSKLGDAIGGITKLLSLFA